MRRYLTVPRKHLGFKQMSSWKWSQISMPAGKWLCFSWKDGISINSLQGTWVFAALMELSVWGGNVGLLIMGPFFLLNLLWSLIVTSIFSICLKFILVLSHYMYLLLVLLLIWKALPKSWGFFWLCTILWITCSTSFSCITDCFFFLAVSQNNVPGDDESSLFHPFACLPNAARSFFVECLIPSSHALLA